MQIVRIPIVPAIVPAILVILLPVLALPAALSAQADPASARALAVYRTQLEQRTRDGSWWWTSNATWATEDGSDAYAMRYVLEPGGVAARGCLWGSRAGATTGVFWSFLQGRDPAGGRAFVFQSGGDGRLGFGYEEIGDGGVRHAEQDFLFTDGTRQRIRHVTRVVGADTLITENFHWRDDGWQPNRTYTWVRRQAGATPCLSAGG